MRNFKLVRIAYIRDGTFGVLFDDLTPFCLTLEREWLNNIRNVSCIPEGKYVCGRVDSPKFGQTFMVGLVPSRSYILFHKGNIEDDSHGCIILGEEYGELKGKIAVLSSGKAFKEFQERLKTVENFNLEIINGIG